MILQNKVAKNAMWLIGCRIVQSVLSLIINMLTARFLGPSNFGLISYAMSIVAFVVPIATIGINNVLVNEFVKNPEKEGETLGTTFVLTLISSAACILGACAFSAVANPGEPITLVVCALYSLSLIAQSLELIQYWFQAKYLAKYTSLVSLCAYVVISVYKIFLLATGKSVYWFAVSYAFDYFLIAIALIIIYSRKHGQRFSFSLSTAKRLIEQGRYYIVSGMMIAIFAQTDKIMLKMMGSSEDVGFYSAAVTIAGMTGFLFIAIIDSMRPLILKNKNNDDEAFSAYMKMLYGLVIYLALAQSLFLTVFAKYVVGIIYGSAYMPAASALQIVVWYTTFSYIGSVRNIWILAEQQQKYLWIINMSGAIANVALNLILIPLAGINGAAIASLVTQVFSNVVMGYLIKPIRQSNVLMVEGMNIKHLFNTVKRYRG